MVDTPSIIVVKDGSAANRNFGTMLDGDSTTQYPQHQPRANNAPVSTANPFPVIPGAGTAIDFSANPASLGGLTLLSTLANDSTRAGGYIIQNQSGTTLSIALDDGAGNNLTIFLLAPGVGDNEQGASVSSDWGIHRGRIRIYGAGGSQVAARAW